MLALLIFINLFSRGAYPHAVAIAFNLLFFGGLVWLIYAGIKAVLVNGQPKYVETLF